MPYDSTDIIDHFKQQGEWAELLFMARAAQHGLSILRPWGDSSPYDVALVLTEKRQLRPYILRVQIKSTRCHHSSGAYKCHIDSNGVPYREGMLDFIAAYVIPAEVWYIIPFAATRKCHAERRSSSARGRSSQSRACPEQLIEGKASNGGLLLTGVAPSSSRRSLSRQACPEPSRRGFDFPRSTEVPETQRVLGWQSEILLAPHRPNSKYAKYKEAWHLLRPDPAPDHFCPLGPGEPCPIRRNEYNGETF